MQQLHLALGRPMETQWTPRMRVACPSLSSVVQPVLVVSPAAQYSKATCQSLCRPHACVSCMHRSQ